MVRRLAGILSGADWEFSRAPRTDQGQTRPLLRVTIATILGPGKCIVKLIVFSHLKRAIPGVVSRVVAVSVIILIVRRVFPYEIYNLGHERNTMFGLFNI